MNNVRYESVLAYLYEALPHVQPRFKQRSRELYGEGLPHVVLGSVMVEYLDSLADELERQSDAINEKRLREAFELIEELSGSDDFEISCLVKTSFMEGLLGGKKGLKRFEAYMGPKTRKLVPLQ